MKCLNEGLDVLDGGGEGAGLPEEGASVEARRLLLRPKGCL